MKKRNRQAEFLTHLRKSVNELPWKTSSLTKKKKRKNPSQLQFSYISTEINGKTIYLYKNTLNFQMFRIITSNIAKEEEEEH